jgi:hypothetical protein
MLRRFLGGERAEQFVQGDDSEGRMRRLKNASEAYPAIRVAVAIMIHAGLRRAETLWLTRGSISPDLAFSVRCEPGRPRDRYRKFPQQRNEIRSVLVKGVSR